MGCAHPAKFAGTVQAAFRLPSEAAAIAAIKAWARYPAARAALDLVASVQGKGGAEGCAYFRWADRCVSGRLIGCVYMRVPARWIDGIEPHTHQKRTNK